MGCVSNDKRMWVESGAGTMVTIIYFSSELYIRVRKIRTINNHSVIYLRENYLTINYFDVHSNYCTEADGITKKLYFVCRREFVSIKKVFSSSKFVTRLYFVFPV